MVLIKRVFQAGFFAAALVLAPVSSGQFSAALGVSQVHAAVVSNIEVRGNSRMDADTVASYLTIRPGENFSDQDIDDSVKALFATGLFGDVSIYRTGRTLIVEVDESGIVNAVFFEGNKRIKDEMITGIVQTEPRSIYSEQKVLSDVERISTAYSRVGREEATVRYEVVPLANNRVNVVFVIDEGDKTKISQLSFIGNNAYSERRLRDVMETKKSHFFSWLKNDDIYDPDRLNSDLERLRQFYFNNGYADFRVIASDVSFDDIENRYMITISVDEGPRYRFGEVGIDSTIRDVDVSTIYPVLETKSGDHYSARKVEDTIIAITQRVAEQGYAFVQVVPRGDRDFETDTINVVYQVDEGPRVYIQQISIVGNDRTREYVIRREFDISEGDPLNQVFLQRAKRRLEALNLFESVDIMTRQGDAPDQRIVVVRVVDKATGEFSIGGGYNTSSGPLAEIAFSERNFLGRGQFLRLSGGFGTESETYRLSFTEPYFLGYRMSAGFDVGISTTDATDERDYQSEVVSGTVRFGVPVTEKLGAQLFYTVADEETRASSAQMEPGSTLDADAIQGNTAGELSAALARNFDWMKSGVGYSLVYNDLNDTRSPTEGTYWSLSQTFYGAGGDAQYVSTTGTAVAYHTFSEDADLIGMLRARGGANILFNDGGNNYRAQDNFYGDGRQIRGFERFGFGPRDPVTGDSLGGLYFWNATAEVTFPMPFLPESMGLRAGFFADAGQLWGLDSTSRGAIVAANAATAGFTTQQLDDNTLRASVGASILWASPFGPLRVDYAIPVSSTSWDEIRNFNFGVSSAF